jgi:nicotinate-nucleotide adenylyltransferase
LNSGNDTPARIGVFGGTFDPIHRTHLDIARAAKNQANLDRVLLVVANIPPHKQHNTDASPEDRYALVEAAVAGEDGIEASHLELDRPGVSYTADTLQLLRDAYPQTELFLIIGMDSLVDLPKWREPERILDAARLLVVPRPGEVSIPAELDGRYDMLDFDPVDVSSTGVRARLENGEELDGIVPAPVAKLIREKGLYGSAANDSAG